MPVLAPTENRVLLERMIARECEALRFTKEQYDQDFPDHSRELSRSEIKLIALRSVMERLCEPDLMAAEQIPDPSQR